MRLLVSLCLIFQPLAAQAGSLELRLPDVGAPVEARFLAVPLLAAGLELPAPAALAPAGESSSPEPEPEAIPDQVPAEAARETADARMAELTGEALPARLAADLPPAVAASESGDHFSPDEKPPERPDRPPRGPDGGRAIRRALLGTAAFKLGMETLSLPVYLWGLSLYHQSPTVVTALALANGAGQIISAGAAGRLIGRFAPQRVLAASVLAQVAIAAALVAAGGTQIFSPWMIFPAYALLGAATGIAEPARRALAPLLVGRDKKTLDHFNGKQHLFYESAGVAGAAGAAYLIAHFGPRLAMLIQPPAYVLAGWLFWSVRPAFASAPESPSEGFYWRDLKLAVKTLTVERWARWTAVSIVLGATVHRLLENALIPLYAAKVLASGGKSGLMLSASDFGELLGALLIMRLAASIVAPRRWALGAALGTLALWALVFHPPLALLLPFVSLYSLTWAANDQSLNSSLQSRLEDEPLSRALGLINALYAAMITAGNIAIGVAFGALAPASALLAINAAFTVMALLLLLAARRL